MQNDRPIEVIVVDDGSTDGTFAVAQALATEHPDLVRTVRQPNAGPGMARERGRQMARGEFIQYLDSDDLLLPGKFRAQVEALRAQPDADVAYGITYWRDASGTLVEVAHKKTGLSIPTMFPEFLVSRWWETATPLYGSRVTDLAGPWTNLSLEEDWEYDCRIASLGGKLVWIAQPVSEHRDHGGQRLSRGGEFNSQRLRQRFLAHSLIFKHALDFGLNPQAPQMQHFARGLFLLSRQCGAAGLTEESRHLFNLSRQAAGPLRGGSGEFRAYAMGANILGWPLMGKISCWLDRARKSQ